MKLLESPSVRLLSLIAAAALLVACDSQTVPDPKPQSAAKIAKSDKPAAPAKSASAAATNVTAKMARAVGNGKPGAAVDIKYDILARPEAGKVVEIQVALVPGPGVEAMEATFTGMEGITVTGPLSANFPEVKAGEPYKHTLSVLPDHDGVFYVSVIVNTKLGNTSLGRTFSIPFVVGKTPVQEKAAPAKDAKGQAVQPMQAEESGS
jgi:hypothetical protein